MSLCIRVATKHNEWALCRKPSRISPHAVITISPFPLHLQPKPLSTLAAPTLDKLSYSLSSVCQKLASLMWKCDQGGQRWDRRARWVARWARWAKGHAHWIRVELAAPRMGAIWPPSLLGAPKQATVFSATTAAGYFDEMDHDAGPSRPWWSWCKSTIVAGSLPASCGHRQAAWQPLSLSATPDSPRRT